MTSGWLASDREALAVDRLLDAAGSEFEERGVRATSMRDIARAAGCSRATLYNYFSDRHALDIAFVQREAIRLSALIADQTRHLDDPYERAVDAIGAALRAVRGDPRLMVWFGEADVGVTTAISADAGVLDAMGTAFAGRLGEGAGSSATRDRARWVVRSIVSLLSMPAADAEEEARIIERFVVPALLRGEGVTV